MAFRSISTNNAPSTSLVVTPPAGIVDGDILVAWTVNDASSGVTTWPAGFVEGASSPQSMSSWDASTFRYALKVAASESGNYTLTGATAVIGGVAAFSGRVQSTTPHRESGSKTDAGAASPFTITSAAFSSATTAEADIVMIGVVDGATPAGDVAFTPPTGYTEDADICQTATFERQFFFAHKDAAAAGETGSLSATGTLAGSSAARAAFAIALATPATAATSGTGTAGISETDVVAGGKVVDTTLTAETYLPASITPQIGYVGGQVGGRAGATSTLAVNFALTGGDVGIASATPQAGDLVVITVVVGSQARNPACAISGYTALGLLNSAAATQDTSLDVSRKFMTATPDTSFTLPSTGNIADAQRYTVQVFRNVNPTTPLDVAVVSATGSATGRPNPGSITPVTSGAYVLICGGGGAGTGANYTAPANYTTNFLTGFTADTNDAMVGSGYRAWTSGAEDPAAYTGGTTNATDSWAAYTIALRPAPATTPFNDARQNYIDGFVSAQSEASGWNAKRSLIPVSAVTRISDTVARLTLPAIGSYDITAQETLTQTVPASILTGGVAIVATPTFTISPAGGGGGGVTVLPDVGAATLAGFAPAIGLPKTVVPGSGAASLTGFAPSVGLPQTVQPGLGAASLTGFAPSVGLPQTARPGLGSASLTGFAPSIGLPKTVAPDAGVATLTGFAPTISTTAAGTTVQPDVGAAAITGFAPAIGLPVTVTPDVGQATFEGFAPEVTTGAVVVEQPAIGAGSGGRGGLELYVSMRAAEAKRRGESKPIDSLVAEPPALVQVAPVVVPPRRVTALEPVDLGKQESITALRPVEAPDYGPSLLPDVVEPEKEPYSDEAIESLRARLRAAEARKAETEALRADVFALGKKEPVQTVSPVAYAAQLAEANRLASEDEELAYVLLIAA